MVTQSTFPLARFRIDLDFELNRRVSLYYLDVYVRKYSALQVYQGWVGILGGRVGIQGVGGVRIPEGMGTPGGCYIKGVDMVGKRAVRILLECFLVHSVILLPDSQLFLDYMMFLKRLAQKAEQNAEESRQKIVTSDHIRAVSKVQRGLVGV